MPALHEGAAQQAAEGVQRLDEAEEPEEGVRPDAAPAGAAGALDGAAGPQAGVVQPGAAVAARLVVPVAGWDGAVGRLGAPSPGVVGARVVAAAAAQALAWLVEQEPGRARVAWPVGVARREAARPGLDGLEQEAVLNQALLVQALLEPALLEQALLVKTVPVKTGTAKVRQPGAEPPPVGPAPGRSGGAQRAARPAGEGRSPPASGPAWRAAARHQWVNRMPGPAGSPEASRGSLVLVDQSRPADVGARSDVRRRQGRRGRWPERWLEE